MFSPLCQVYGVVVIIGWTNLYFSSKSSIVDVTWSKVEGAYIVAIIEDSAFVLVLPGEHDVIMPGETGVGVLLLLLFGHGLLHPVLWRQQVHIAIWDIVGVWDGVYVYHAVFILPFPADGANLDIGDLGPPESFDGAPDWAWGVNEVGNVM